MNVEKICLSSKTIDIAENDLYLELTNRMCYYDDKNLNNVLLPYKGVEESALECAKSLINMPVQAKYKKIEGQDDLGSHEMYITPDGEVVFGTESIGTHVDVWIEETDVVTVSGETRKLPCLYAKKRIWKRNKNLINAIKRLYESEDGLGSSWEIQTLEYIYKDGIKKLTNYLFLSDCLLGSTTTPAYNGTSKAISLSAISEQELMVAEALSIDLSENQGETFDINDNQKKEENILKKDKNINLSSEENVDGVTTTEEVSEDKNNDTNAVSETDIENSEGEKEPSTETSALTSYDLRKKISKACRDKVDDWCWVAYLFPEEHEVWCEYDGESELDYLKFTYTVENDEVIVSEPEKVKLTVSVAEINSKIAELEAEVSTKDEAIIKSGEEIARLKTEIYELTPFKEKFEKAEQDRIENELKEKKDALVSSITKSGLITKEEIEESEELKGYVNNLDEKSLKAVLADRYIASLGEDTATTTTEVSQSNTNNEPETASTNLDGLEDEELDVKSIMKNYFGK